MPQKPGRFIALSVAIALMGIMGTIIGTAFVVGRMAVTREEVTRMMQTESPYVKDSRYINETLVTVNTQLGQINQNQGAMFGQLARIEGKLQGHIDVN